MKRVLVTGGRDFGFKKSEIEKITAALDRYLSKRGMALLMHGACRGLDQAAGIWASARGIPVKAYPADWTRYQEAAGPIRNKQMVEEGRPDVVIAFPGGKGTRNMKKHAEKAGIPIWEPLK